MTAPASSTSRPIPRRSASPTSGNVPDRVRSMYLLRAAESARRPGGLGGAHVRRLRLHRQGPRAHDGQPPKREAAKRHPQRTARGIAARPRLYAADLPPTWARRRLGHFPGGFNPFAPRPVGLGVAPISALVLSTSESRDLSSRPDKASAAFAPPVTAQARRGSTTRTESGHSILTDNAIHSSWWTAAGTAPAALPPIVAVTSPGCWRAVRFHARRVSET